MHISRRVAKVESVATPRAPRPQVQRTRWLESRSCALYSSTHVRRYSQQSDSQADSKSPVQVLGGNSAKEDERCAAEDGRAENMLGTTPKREKTIAELDAELQAKMEGRAGDGGEAGVELEDGQPVAMKRGVKNNMFRYI